VLSGWENTSNRVSSTRIYVYMASDSMKIETLALYALRKYRYLKNAYYSDEGVKGNTVPTLDRVSKDSEKD